MHFLKINPITISIPGILKRIFRNTPVFPSAKIFFNTLTYITTTTTTTIIIITMIQVVLFG